MRIIIQSCLLKVNNNAHHHHCTYAYQCSMLAHAVSQLGTIMIAFVSLTHAHMHKKVFDVYIHMHFSIYSRKYRCRHICTHNRAKYTKQYTNKTAKRKININTHRHTHTHTHRAPTTKLANPSGHRPSDDMRNTPGCPLGPKRNCSWNRGSALLSGHLRFGHTRSYAYT